MGGAAASLARPVRLPPCAYCALCRLPVREEMCERRQNLAKNTREVYKSHLRGFRAKKKHLEIAKDVQAHLRSTPYVVLADSPGEPATAQAHVPGAHHARREREGV